MGRDRSVGRGRGSSLVVGGVLVEVAQRLAEQAEEIRRAADLMEMVARLGSQAGSSPRALSEAMAHALIDVRAGEEATARQPGGIGPGPSRGRDSGRAGMDAAATDVIPPPRRLWKDTPLVVVQAATARSYGRSVLCALGITPDGRKRVLGYRWETTSMQASAGAFIEDLFERGVRAPSESQLLFVTDGGPVLDQAIARRYPASHRALCRRAFSERVLAYLAKSSAEGEAREALRHAFGRRPTEMRQGL